MGRVYTQSIDMSRVAVSPSVIRWARERAGRPVQVLAQRFPKFERWESGAEKPTLRQLEALAKATLTPLGYFFLPEPPEDRLPIPDFRTVADTPVRRPSPNLLETVQIMQRRQAWMREFLIEEGHPPLPFVASAQSTNGSLSVAGEMREVLRIDAGWAQRQHTWSDALRELRRTIEHAGILVVANGVVGNNTHRKLDPSEFRGFVLADEYAPLIFVNAADGKAAQMFTLAHEVAHLWFGQSAVFDLRDLQPANDEVEKACNRVAAEFLIAEQELRACWPEVKREPDRFQAVARHFKVSTLVAARRALDLRLMTKAEFLEFYRRYQADERRQAAKKASGGDFFATQDVRVGRRFAGAVVQAAKEGRLLYRDAYDLTGLYGKSFDRYAATLGLAPAR
jgi:Zn-dependent peptidase ImmA (M78 family)